MKKLISKLEKLIPPYDKLMHFYVGTWIALTTAIILAKFFEGEYKILVIIVTILAGIYKELYDVYFKKSKFDVMDVFYTAIVSVPITILMCLMK